MTPPPDLSLLLYLPGAALLASAGLLAFALRGRRVDEHPVCRRCGFDLFGRPEGSTVCSECGSDLNRRRAVRIGVRRPRRRLAAVASPAVVLCVAWFALLGWGRWRGTNWDSHKPVWWLMRDARGGHVAARDAAFVELAARIKAGTLPQPQTDAAVDLALDLQADDARPWSDAIGDTVGAAQDADRLSPERWRRYARQATHLDLAARPTYRRGDPLMVRVSWRTPPRMSSRHTFHATFEGTDYLIGAVRVTPTCRSSDSPVHPASPSAVAPGFATTNAAAVATVPDGPNTLTAAVRLRIAEGARDRTALFDERVTVSAPVTVLPAGAAPVGINKDPALKAAVEGALQLSNLSLTRKADSHLPAVLEGQVYAKGSPVGLSFRVIARAGSREWDLGAVKFPPREWSSRSFGATLDVLPSFPPDAAAVDIILRPSPDGAAATFDITEIWGEEVVRPGVWIVRTSSR